MNFISKFQPQFIKEVPHWYVGILDCIIVVFSGYVGKYFEIGGLNFAKQFWPITLGLLFCILLFLLSFRLFHTYMGVMRYSSLSDLRRLVFATIAGACMTYILSFICNAFEWTGMQSFILPNISGVFVMFVFASLLMVLVRILVQCLFDAFSISNKTKKAFIYGVREGGVGIAISISHQMPQKFTLVGFVSPNGDLETKYLMGVKVRKDGPDLVKHMKRAGANVLIVSPLQSEHFNERQELISELIDNDIRILVMPQAEEWDKKSALHHEQLHEIEIENLLPREKIEVDMKAIGELLSNKRILITGAAGSIGSEIVRQVAKFNPAEMILIDQAETPMHDIRLMMARKFPDIKAETIVSSITDKEHMEKIFSDHKPEYVFHAAAYKHVPMMEDNPGQAVRNNIYGTRIIADLAVKYDTKKFVMISTDKAVNPTNVMGCSKRICEIYCQALNKAIADGKVKGETQFVTTRFGNVLGSNGSVIHIFKEQIAKGGPITVTHPDIIRYFMLIPEACKLVLEAGTMGHGGEIFVFDMGKPVKIVDLAKRMIKLSGAKNVEIKYSGLRDGEKLYEEMLSNKENTKPTIHPKIQIAQVREYDYETAVANEERLMEASNGFDDMAIVKIMKEIVPEYTSNNSKYTFLDKKSAS